MTRLLTLAACLLLFLCAGAAPQKGSYQSLYDAHNDERAIQTLLDGRARAVLVANADLERIAAAYAAYLAREGVCASPHYCDGLGPQGRAIVGGYLTVGEDGRPDGVVGENLWYGNYQINQRDLMDGWMRSSGHRGNILSEAWTEIGAGKAKAGRLTIWVVMFGDRF